MNKALPFLKSHWIILVCLIVPIGTVAAGWIFSSKWNASIKSEMEESVSKDLRAIKGITLQFEIPQLDPQAEPIRFSMAPNRATVNLAGEMLQSNIEQSKQIRRLALEHNQKSRELLIDGPTPQDKLFPAPSNNASRLRKLSQIRTAWPQAHIDLLDSVQAGAAIDPQAVTDELTRFREQEIARFLGDRVEQTLSEDEQAAIDLRVSERRVELSRSRAAELAFYADPSVFEGVHSVEEADSVGQVTLPIAWEWQHRYWTHEEVIRAIRAANSDPASGLYLPVYQAPVKRVLSVSAEPWDFIAAVSATGATPSADISREIPRDFNRSITGRTRSEERRVGKECRSRWSPYH